MKKGRYCLSQSNSNGLFALQRNYLGLSITMRYNYLGLSITMRYNYLVCTQFCYSNSLESSVKKVRILLRMLLSFLHSSLEMSKPLL